MNFLSLYMCCDGLMHLRVMILCRKLCAVQTMLLSHSKFMFSCQSFNKPEYRVDIMVVGFQVLGGVEKSESGDVTGAKVLALTYFMAGNKTLIDDDKDDEPMRGWEEELLDKLEVRNDSSSLSAQLLVSVSRGRTCFMFSLDRVW